MKLVLTLIRLDEVDDLATLGYFDAVSLKFNQYNLKTYALLDGYGVERHAWEWADFGSPNQAKARGRQHGLACFKHGIKEFYINAESQWAGTGRFPKTENPYHNMVVYVEEFRIHAPADCKLIYNGFSWNRTSDGRRLHDDKLISRFDGWCAMNYGTTKETLEKHWEHKTFRYKDTGVKCYAMVGVGRIDNQGRVWGYWDTHRKLLLETQPDGVCWFFGNGARNQMTEGHIDHPPLVNCADQLRRDLKWLKC